MTYLRKHPRAEVIMGTIIFHALAFTVALILLPNVPTGYVLAIPYVWLVVYLKRHELLPVRVRVHDIDAEWRAWNG